jgi:hypothetical protein
MRVEGRSLRISAEEEIFQPFRFFPRPPTSDPSFHLAGHVFHIIPSSHARQVHEHTPSDVLYRHHHPQPRSILTHSTLALFWHRYAGLNFMPRPATSSPSVAMIISRLALHPSIAILC